MLRFVIKSRKLATIRKQAKNRITALGFQSRKVDYYCHSVYIIYITPVLNYTLNDINISVHVPTNSCVFQP